MVTHAIISVMSRERKEQFTLLYTLFTLHFQTMLAQFVTCLCSFSYKCKHYQNSAEATVMGLPCFGVPGWFRNSLGNDFTTVLVRFVHVV